MKIFLSGEGLSWLTFWIAIGMFSFVEVQFCKSFIGSADLVLYYFVKCKAQNDNECFFLLDTFTQGVTWWWGA